MRVLSPICAAALVAVLSGCSTRQVAPVPPAPTHGHFGAQYGVVQHIDTVHGRERTTGTGAVVGGLIGGVVGRELTRGGHKGLGTGVGAVAGAVLGNEIEKSNRGTQEIYRVTVRLDRGGGQRSFDYAQLYDLRLGDRVRIENNQLYRW